MIRFIKYLLTYFFFISQCFAFEAVQQSFPLEEDVLCEKMVEVYRSINQNWTYPTDNKTLVETVPNWTRREVHTNQGTTSMVCWDFNTQPAFSKALEEIITHPLKMECSN